MSGVKMFAGFACGVTALLFILLLNVPDPESVLYDEAVAMLMEQEGLTSKREIEESFPMLMDIKSDINRIAHLEQIVQRKTHGPKPITSQEDVRQLEADLDRIHQLREGVRTGLSQLQTAFAKN